jgi:hypothetical protein
VTTLVFSVVLVLLGVAIIIRTIAGGVGGGLGLLIGALFIIAGGLRAYLQTRPFAGKDANG